MIATASRFTDAHFDAYLGSYSKPSTRVVSRPSREARIEARYDAASSSTEFSNYWANADALDSDSANSRGVRLRLVHRSRYEVDNNGYTDGIVQTHANYLVSTGPTIRVSTGNKGLDALVSDQWRKWSKAIGLRRKLWCMAHAKVQDGESFGLISFNPLIDHRIKLDLQLYECEQFATPYLPYRAVGVIDGMAFDAWNNPIYYDLLPQHPGSQWAIYGQIPNQVSPRYVCHWFQMRRPGQHRGVPELKSTMQVGAASRRWREATVAAAESAADFAAILYTEATPEETEQAAPFSTMPIDKRMFTALPHGNKMQQLKAEHPNAVYSDFNRQQISEQGRPKSMPYNLSACDSSNHNYASGKLDREAYYVSLDVEREDGSELVLDKLWREWSREAEAWLGLSRDRLRAADVSWDWPSHPVADVESEASANDKKLRNGTSSPSRIYTECGENFDVEVARMAKDYGVDEQTVRNTIFHAVFNDRNQQASMVQARTQAQGAANG